MILDLRVIHLVLKYDSTTHMIRWKLAGWLVGELGPKAFGLDKPQSVRLAAD